MERTRAGCRPETEAMYRGALELYGSTDISLAEICRRCNVSVKGFSRYVRTYHRHLMLRRNGIRCSAGEAAGIRLSQRRGQRPDTHIRYKDAIAACDSMEYIGCNVSEIAREFGLSGPNLSRQLRTHYPDVLEFRERARARMGLDDGLPRGSRRRSKEQYAQTVELLRSDRYITVQEAAERCSVSYAGLEQHLIFYHKDLVEERIRIREKAAGEQRRGELTGRGTLHAPTREITEKYAAALHLYKTTPMSARKIARQAGVSVKGFYEYLQTWHKDLVGERKGNPATAAKYAEAIALLKEGGLTAAAAASRFGLHPDCLRRYLKDHEPELHASLGMKKSESGGVMAMQSMDKYKEALQVYATSAESIKSLARRYGLNDCAFGQFIRRQFPELHEKHKALVQQTKKGE